MKRLSFALVLAAACTIQDPALEPRDIQVSLVAENPPNQVRATVAWVTTSTVFFGPDVDLSTGASTLTVVRPPEVSEDSLVSTQSLQFSETNVALSRLRIVIYTDGDGSRSFDPRGDGSPDTIIAIDPLPEAAFAIHLEEALSAMSLADAENYYRFTGQRFTPILRVRAMDGSREFSVATMVPTSLDRTVQLEAAPSPVLRASLVCGDLLGIRFGPPLLGSLSRVTTKLFVDTSTAVDCPVSVGDCEITDLDSEAPPDFTVFDRATEQREVQCRRNGTLEALVVTQATVVCRACSCNSEGESWVYLVDPKSRPGWWPCGDSIDYCDASTSLLQLAVCRAPTDG